MKKMKVLALVLVFAFGALGGAYAYWYDSIFINETVDTGIVNLQWSCIDVSDPSPNYENYTDVYGGSTDDDTIFANENYRDDKNVAFKDAELKNDTITSDMGAWDGSRGYYGGAPDTDVRALNDILKITLHNGYPGYVAYVNACINNIGTVPTKFYVNTDNIPAWLQFQICEYDLSTQTIGDILFDNVEGIDQFEGMQLDPDEELDVIIVETVLDTAPQDAITKFEIELKGIQWNGYDPAPAV